MQSISVVIPVFNNSQFIRCAIDSALKQEHLPAEIIVIDDGSTDSTAAVVADYGNQVHYVYQENQGSGTARNKGIRLASHPWIAFLDADDYWAPDHLAKLVACRDGAPEARLVYCGKKWVDKDGEILPNVGLQENFPSGWIFYPLFSANYISSSSVAMAERDAILAVGAFNENPEFRNAQDYDLWLRLAARFPVGAVKEYTVFYRRHDSNRTLDSSSRHRGLVHTLEHAFEIHQNGQLDPLNISDGMEPKVRLRRAYDDAISEAFYGGRYSDIKAIASRGQRYGRSERRAVIHLLLSRFPHGLLSFMRKAKSQYSG